MSSDFRTGQLRVNQIINSGSTATSPLLIYGMGSVTDEVGGFTTSHFTTGSDTWLFISGSSGSKNSTSRGVVTFKGDVVVSGAIYNAAGVAYSTSGGGGTSNWNELSPSPRLNSTASVAIAGGLGSNYAAQNAGADVFFFVSGTTGVAGSSARKSVFAGDVRISGSLSQGFATTTTGLYSHAEGFETTSSADYSHAEGYQTRASGVSSHAEGRSTISTGQFSHAEGQGAESKGFYSHAEGSNTISSGSHSHAEGFSSVSLGDYSHAEGQSSVASGSYSHAEGASSIARGISSHAEGSNSLASGIASHAEGSGTTSSGNHSHAEGAGTNASNDGSHAEGYFSVASGAYSHAEGSSSTASGIASHAEGISSTASAQGSHAEGYQTVASAQYSHAEGNATAARADSSHAEGYQTVASGSYSHAEGRQTLTSGSYSHAEGYLTVTSGSYSHAEGQSTIASGSYSHAEGFESISSGQYSHAEGSGATSSGQYSHAEGVGTTSSGIGSHAEGIGTNSSGGWSHAEGNGATSSGDYSHAEGQNTTSSGQYSHAEGNQTVASGQYSHAEGGSGGGGATLTAAGNYSHAEGYNTVALGSYTHTEGYGSKAGNVGFESSDAGSSTPGTIIVNSSYGNISGLFGSYIIFDDSEYSGVYGYTTFLISSVSWNGTNTVITLIDSTVSTPTGAVIGNGQAQPAGADYSLANVAGQHAEGYDTNASGDYSHAEGYETVAAGAYSHAEGFQTIAAGVGSKASGYQAKAYGQYSSVNGQGTIASGSYQYVVGKYNTRSNPDSLFIVGDGSGDSNSQRRDVLRVNSGSVQVTGSLIASRITGSIRSTAGGLDFIVGSGVTANYNSSGQWELTASGGGGGSPGGSDTFVQFNDGGSTFGGDSGLTYNKTSDTLTGVTIKATGGLSGSLKTLTDGTPYLVASSSSNMAQTGSISITSGSANGQVTVNSYVFPSDLTVSLTGGRTFGRYASGATIPATGKTPAEVILLAIAEPINPTVNLTPTNPITSTFGISGSITTSVTGSYTINTLGATVSTAALQFRSGSTGAWTTLTSATTNPLNYDHTFTVGSFFTTVLNYQYIITDSAGATTTTAVNLTPQAYAAPTMSLTITTTTGGGFTNETNLLRERGNVGSTITGTITRNRVNAPISSYSVQYQVNGSGGWTDVPGLSAVPVSGNPSSISIPSTVHNNSALNTSLSLFYRIQVVDSYQTSTGSSAIVIFRYGIFYGPSTTAPANSADVRALGTKTLVDTGGTTELNTGNTQTNFTMALPTTVAASDTISSVIDLDALNADITASYVLSTFNVNDGGGTAVSYKVYTMTIASPYASSHRHSIVRA